MKNLNLAVFFSSVAVCLVSSAPAGHEVDKKAAIGDRESTNEILNLEQQLKLQAGENKKFFPSRGSHAVPQVDGLNEAVNSGEEDRNELEPAPGNTALNTDDFEDTQDMKTENNMPSLEELDPRKVALMEEVKEMLDDDILKLLKEHPELWEDVLTGKIY